METSKEPKDVTIEMDERFFQITLSIKEEALIEGILKGLAESVTKGAHLRIRQSHRSSHSDSQRVMQKVVSNVGQMNSWLAETRLLRCVVCTAKE